ncbi:MAG: hypothetical protein R3D44_18450 [Hyphomicrobiaceae bacterium]
MKTFWTSVFALLCLVRGACAADGDSNAARHEALQLLMRELGLQPRQIEVIMRDHPLDKWLPSLIEAHARQFGKDPERLQTVGDHLARTRLVLVDGTMASPVYQLALTVERNQLPILRPFQIDDWQRASPKSAQPGLAGAQARLDLAAGDWRVAYFRANSAEGQTLNASQLADLERHLVANKSVIAQDPTWYALMVELAVYRRAAEAEIKALVAEGLLAFPENIQLAVDGATYYLPKWKGDPSRLGAYAAWVLSLPGMSNRLDIYPRIYSHALYRQFRLTLFRAVAKDWDAIRRGIRHMLATYPAKSNKNSAALLACLAGDRELTHQILYEPAFELEAELWLDHDAPGLCMQWARQPMSAERSKT